MSRRPTRHTLRRTSRAVTSAASRESPVLDPTAPTRGADPKRRRGRLESLLERSAPEVVTASCWFEPPPQPPRQSVTIQFSGRRLEATGRPTAGDRFVHHEVVDGVVAGAGPVAVTAQVGGVRPGHWLVRARVVSCRPDERPQTDRQADRRRSVTSIHPAQWSWRRWRISRGTPAPIATGLAPFAGRPAVIPGSWAALAALGIALALITQALLVPADLDLGRVLTISLLALLAGAIGAKAWFVILHRHERRREGWCVQGLVAGVLVAAPPLLVLLSIPPGVFLDASTPGLMLGLAVGRIGCFFTGCCAGRQSSSRWAIWSSNRRVGARRVPTQLLESALALTIGTASLTELLAFGTRRGTLFVAAIAVYTLLRQGLLRLREERRRSRHGLLLVTAAAAAVLAVDLVLFASV